MEVKEKCEEKERSELDKVQHAKSTKGEKKDTRRCSAVRR